VSAERAPSAFASLLVAADFADAPAPEIAIVGNPADDATQALIDAVRDRYLPNRVVALARPGETVAGLPLLEGKTAADGIPVAYVCRSRVCSAPTSDPRALARDLQNDRPRGRPPGA
jgi:hypothetical protein